MAIGLGLLGIAAALGIHWGLHLADAFPLGVAYHPRHDLLSWAAAWSVATILAAVIAGRVASARALDRAVPFAVGGGVLAVIALTVYALAVYVGTPTVAGWDGPERVTPFHVQLAPTLMLTMGLVPVILVASAWSARRRGRL